MQMVENTRGYWAPMLESGIIFAEENPNNQTYRPAVIVHGMGDAVGHTRVPQQFIVLSSPCLMPPITQGTNPGMKSICKTVGEKYPGIFTLCSTTADGIASITTKMSKQVEHFTAELRSHPELSQGFNAVGLSQGNFLIEGSCLLLLLLSGFSIAN